MAFRGSAPAKIDDRGRLKIPVAFRDFFIGNPQVFVTFRERMPLLVYPLSTYEEQVERGVETRAGLDEAQALVLRRLNANGQAVQVDAQGRLSLSQDVRERTGLEAGKGIRVVGMRDYLELWTEEELTKAMRRG